jgi:hypothetical protein
VCGDRGRRFPNIAKTICSQLPKVLEPEKLGELLSRSANHLGVVLDLLHGRMRSWLRDDKIVILLNAAAAVALAIGWTLYALYGHQVVEAMYKRESIEVLDTIIEGQEIHPLAHYLQDADRLMQFISVLLIVVSAFLSVLLKIFPPSPSTLDLVLSFLSQSTTALLTGLFFLFSLSASAIAFFYPLEIETRESTVWLAVLALRAGINIYDQSQVVFVNLNHGPFDPLLKSAIATSFPFLESWQVTRFPVLILPYLFLTLAWRMIRKSAVESFLRVVFLGSMGYLFLVVSAKEFLFVGRSDSTVAVLLLILLCISTSPFTQRKWVTALRGFLSGLLATLVILTNWRTGPTAVAILLFTFWHLRSDKEASRRLLGVYAGCCAIASLITSGLMLYHVSKLNLSIYYKYFFGFYSNAAGWSAGESFNGLAMAFFLSLFDPTASPGSLKGGPLVLALFVCALVLWKRGAISNENRAWLFLAFCSFSFCALAYYLNYWGGGSWYFIPFLIILWCFLCSNCLSISQARLNLLGIVLLGLLCVNFRTALAPTISRASRIQEARALMARVRSLQETSSIVSEDTFFFRTRYRGELIDMGDTASVFAKSAYFGHDFRQTVQRHFAEVQSNPPDYIITGFTESPELRALIKEKYTLIADGPANFTANGGGESKLYMRKDLRT